MTALRMLWLVQTRQREEYESAYKRMTKAVTGETCTRKLSLLFHLLKGERIHLKAADDGPASPAENDQKSNFHHT